MRQLLFPALLGALASVSALASPHYSFVGKPDAQIYFGHIAYCDLRGDDSDPTILREGRDATERAIPNAPLLPGDTLVTGAFRRCEAQFDTGTVVRLDGATRLRIETILAPALTRKAGVTNFLLARGRVEVRYRHYEKSEVFQVLTPTAAVKIRDRAEATIGVEADGATGVETQSGSVQVLFGRGANKTRERKVTAGHRFVFGAGRAGGEEERAETADLLDFRAWNEIRDGETPAEPLSAEHRPAPMMEDPPPVVVDFAARSASWGDWVSSDVYGSVWRPYDNERPDWRPYLEGRWAPIQGDLFWVADEPWGWVPYHLGYWTRLRQHGWVWVPGSWFAPAWVRWAPGWMQVGWRPLDFWDFYADDTAMAWFGSDGGGNAPSLPPDRPPAHAVPRRPPPPAPDNPLPPERPRPREIRRVLEHLSEAPRASLDTLRDEAAMVRRSAVIVPWDKVSPEGKAETRRAQATPSPAVAPSPEPPVATPGIIYVPIPTETALPDFPRARFRDWNPDAPVARAMGGLITYSSHDNSVRCASCPAPLPRLGGGLASPEGGASSGSQTGGASSGGATPNVAPATAGGGQGAGHASGGARREN